MRFICLMRSCAVLAVLLAASAVVIAQEDAPKGGNDGDASEKKLIGDFDAAVKYFADYTNPEGEPARLKYDARGYVNRKGRISKGEKTADPDEEFYGLGCSSFASAILYRLVGKGRGNKEWSQLSTVIHQEWGNGIADHYALKAVTPRARAGGGKDVDKKAFTVREFRDAAVAGTLERGLFFFDIRDELGALGRKVGDRLPGTEKRATEKDVGAGHVGFLVVASEGEGKPNAIRHVQFSKIGEESGLKDESGFIKNWLDNAKIYSDGRKEESSTISLYRITGAE